MVAKSKQLTENWQMEVLQHIYLHTITTRKALKTLPCFKNPTNDTIQGAIRRLSKPNKLIARGRLYGNVSYYYLTQAGAAAIGEVVPGTPLKIDPLIRKFFILAFCRLQHPVRELIEKREYKETFPYRKGQRINFYLDHEYTLPRLSYLRVDFSKSAKSTQIISYIRRDIAKVFGFGEFRELMDNDELQITVLTCVPQRAQRLKQAIKILQQPLAVPVKVVAVEQARPLLFPTSF